MPATEQTCYHLPRLHKVFALSSVVLLVATIWMFAIDHQRSWKRIQRNHDRMARKMTQWRQRQLLTDEMERAAEPSRDPRSEPGVKWLEWPLLDVFNSPRRIENLWSDGLEQPVGSFGRVRRFDRCATCHHSIHKLCPDAADQPAFPTEQLIELIVDLPAAAPPPAGRSAGPDADTERQVLDLIGVQFTRGGLLNDSDVAVMHVRPHSPAVSARPATSAGTLMLAGDIRDRMFQAVSDESPRPRRPGLRLGDVLVAVDDGPWTTSRATPFEVVGRILESARRAWDAASADGSAGAELRLTVRRGVPSPYAGHPRLDLFVADRSPHPMTRFGCTVCHAGQGSATSFEWAAHAPNDPAARRAWKSQYGWFDNPHWPFPMLPSRFAQSACVQCHHNVTELEPSDRFPDPPAPRLLEGYRLVLALGCFGCHEIHGYQGPDQRVGPDVRLEPNYYAAALQFRGDPTSGYDRLTASEQSWVERLIRHPDDASARHQIRDLIRDDAHRVPGSEDELRSADPEAPDAAGSGGPGADRRFGPTVLHSLLPLLKDHETPGTFRKVGPSLRFVRAKLDRAYLHDWIRHPAGRRPATRMPGSFGLWDHLPAADLRRQRETLQRELHELVDPDPERGSRTRARLRDQITRLDAAILAVDRPEERWEPIMIHSMVRYLLDRSQAYAELDPEPGIAAVATDPLHAAQIERGRIAFEQSGCLACHDHADFPDIRKYREPDFLPTGPDLTDASVKFDATRNPDGRPWLYGWIEQPSRYDPRTTMPDFVDRPVAQASESGEREAVADPVGDIVAYLLSRPSPTAVPLEEIPQVLSQEQRQALEELTLAYLRDMFSESAARRYLVEGIPEDLGESLTGAERELIVPANQRSGMSDDDHVQRRTMYVARKALAHHGCHACHDIPGLEDAQPIGPALTDWGRKDTSQLAFGHILPYVEAPPDSEQAGEAAGGSGARPDGAESSVPRAPLPAYYLEELRARSRIGFMFQKLAEPRSYDFHEAEHKRYTERLRMPQFQLTASQREAIMTFVLGLTADPPGPGYVFEPDPRARAILEGREVLIRYSCQECHLLDVESWDLAFPADFHGPQRRQPTFPFMAARFSTEAVRTSTERDASGLRTATLLGMPAVSDDGKAMIFDDEDFPIADEEDEWFDQDRLIYAFDLWRPALLDGEVYQVGDGAVEIPAEHLRARRRSRSGALTKYLLPRVVRREKESNPNAKGGEAWAWLPPSLLGQTARVQLDWLHDYLLDPLPVRPAVVMQMPRYRLSQQEATQLVHYFAARDRTDYPFQFRAEQRADHLSEAEARYTLALAELRRHGELDAEEPIANRHLVDAMRVIASENYCVKCHIIGDFDPGGSNRVKAPDLLAVHRRLRADFLRRWIAKPTAELPYTAMPVNIPYDPAAPRFGTTVPQDLYRGNSLEQLDALVDLLMNYDQYLLQHAPLTPLTTDPGR